jgi:GntR family transcriptional regulator/MocR family aminotransferase
MAPFAKGLVMYDTPEPGRLRAFRTNVPALDLFPTTLWAQVASRRLRRATAASLHGCEAAGYPALRAAVADYLTLSRGVACSEDRVLIVSGVQEALDLALRVLLVPGDRVALEEPGHIGARYLFAAARARIVRVPVDAEGATLDPRRLEGVRLLYVTPAHQFPLGVSMSLPRRVAVLEWARQAGALIFEDDYDSEFRYSGRPLPALQGLGGEDHTLFAGSFSKVLFPALRLGYLVLPQDLVDPFSAALSVTRRHAPVLEQAVLADFIEGGHFARHIRRMRSAYAERLGVLTEAAKRRLRGRLEVSEVEAGLQTVGWLAPGLEAGRVAAAARERGVRLVPISQYGRLRGPRQGVHMGFAAVEPREIRRGIDELAGILAAEA